MRIDANMNAMKQGQYGERADETQLLTDDREDEVGVGIGQEAHFSRL